MQNGSADAHGGRVLHLAIQALEAHGEGRLHRSQHDVASHAERLGVRLPEGLTALLEHFGNGCSGRAGGQSLLSPDELGYLAALDGVEEPVSTGAGVSLDPANIVAFTDEELDGSVWCLLTDGTEPVAVGRFVPGGDEPAIVDLVSSFEAWLTLLVEAEGELVSSRSRRKADDGDRTRTISLEG